MDIDSKLPTVGTTIFTVMSKMAADCGAINLSQGYPDFSVPSGLVERLNHYTRNGYNQYPPMHGIPYLREQVARKVQDIHEVSYDPEKEITIVSGATEGIFVAVQAVVRSGDEVIVFDPAYDAYDPAVSLAGGRTIHIPLAGPDFQIDWQRLEDAIGAKTRAIIVNSPQNPTGSVISADDLRQLAALTSGRDIYFISDEVYEHMVFDGIAHHSLCTLPELRQRAFVISSFGKTFHATGWKIGYCLAPPALTREFRKVHQFVTFTTHTPSQWAIADYLDHHPEHHRQLPAFYKAKRDLFLAETAGIGFEMLPSKGTYFQMASYHQLSVEPDTQFVETLTRQAGVAAIPVSVFYETAPEFRFVRFCFAKEDETLREAAGKLRAFFS